MKVGILTFHWATNYGAVLQAYALQSYLSQLYKEVKIIDYLPANHEKKFAKIFLTKRPSQIGPRILEYAKEQRFIKFRDLHLNLTDRYSSSNELQSTPPKCDAYICGSDQIWNPSFTISGEGKKTLSYFLDFGNETTARIAYAVSFGCENYPVEAAELVIPELKRFNAISVREKSGCKIIRNFGLKDPEIMPDPSLLLSSYDYDKLCDGMVSYPNNFNFFYYIHNNQQTIHEIETYFRAFFKERVISTRSSKYATISINQWLAFIKKAKTVVTNSFHGLVFSIIFKKNFIVIPVEGQLHGMNDRVYTLLNQLGLQNRLVDSCSKEKLNMALSTQIDWDQVENRIQELRKAALIFFKTSIVSTQEKNFSNI